MDSYNPFLFLYMAIGKWLKKRRIWFFKRNHMSRLSGTKESRIVI